MAFIASASGTLKPKTTAGDESRTSRSKLNAWGQFHTGSTIGTRAAILWSRLDDSIDPSIWSVLLISSISKGWKARDQVFGVLFLRLCCAVLCSWSEHFLSRCFHSVSCLCDKLAFRSGMMVWSSGAWKSVLRVRGLISIMSRYF